MHQLCFQYMLNYSGVIYRCQKSERVRERAAHMNGSVYLGKIENSSDYQELISHPMPWCKGCVHSMVQGLWS